MSNVTKVTKIMLECSMPLELTMAELKEQASDMNMPINYLSGYLNKNLQIKNDAIIKWFEYNVRLSDSIRLVKALLERFDKPSESIDDIYEKDDMCFLIRHGLVFISEEERRQREQGTQYIDELLDALNDVITNSQQEIEELEEARDKLAEEINQKLNQMEEKRDKLVEEINQKRSQMLQGIEALRSRLAELGADCDNILPQRDERIREME